MIFRLSHKLNATIKSGTLAALPLHECPLADWSAHLFVAGRSQYTLLSHPTSLSSTLMPGRGITNGREFIKHAVGGIRELMEEQGRKDVYDRLIAPASESVRFARALDRSVTGWMNELIHHATVELAEGGVSPQEIGGRLNDALLSALAPGESAAYGKPRDAFEALVRGNEGGGP